MIKENTRKLGRKKNIKFYSKQVAYFLVFWGTMFGCGNKSSDEHKLLTNNEKYHFSAASYQQALSKRFDSTATSLTLPFTHFVHYDTLGNFYSQKEFYPTVIKSLDDLSIINPILSFLEHANEHGLNPQKYDCQLIRSEAEQILDTATLNDDLRYQHLANVELLLANAVVTYASDLRYGVVNPVALYGESYGIPVVDSAKRTLLQPLYQENLLAYLNEIQPKSERYKKLQALLPLYESLQRQTWFPIRPPDKKIKLGEKSSLIHQVISRLITLGFIDTVKTKEKNLDTYDSTLIKAVRAFQKASGLINDGDIGKATVEKLNMKPAQYLEKIKLTLERFRWTSYTDSSHYLLVNVPDFYLRAIEKNNELFNIKVCTGRRRPSNFEARMKIYEKTKNWRNRPDDWETPQLYGRIKYLILNPTWTVPTNIIREEIYNKSLKDSLYLRKERFKVMLGNKEVNLAEVDLRKYPRNKIPYTFVQDPGAGNALGRIKFMFANKFDIYLHDTPTRPPFFTSNRAVSHGCIRLEKPLELAEYVLKNNSKWNTDFVKIEIGLSPADKSSIAEFRNLRTELRQNFSLGKTTQVNLERSIPLYVDYFTAWVDEKGIPNFRDDVYGKDEKLKQALAGKLQ